MLVQGRVHSEILELEHFGPYHRIPHPHIGLDAPQPVISSKEAFSEATYHSNTYILNPYFFFSFLFLKMLIQQVTHLPWNDMPVLNVKIIMRTKDVGGND